MVFIPNPDFEDELLEEDEGTDALKAGAEDAKARAQSIAPVLTGDYRDSFVVIEEEGEVRLGNTDWKSHLLEWGTVDTPTYAPLRRGVRMAGYRLDESER